MKQKTISIFLSVITFFLVITNISVKDSWIYATKFNNELFSKLNTAIKENNIENGNICLEYDMSDELKSNPNLILREPLFYNDWEAPLLSEMNGIDPKKIHVYNKDRKVSCEIIFHYKNGRMTRAK
ncbi:hypothetical protein [Chryseobacterium sp. CH21]|uniref:hypothetical protein n=1 Tax=Chryseobacterium sp. CH21 TaxID=713556 RepID=UPI0013E994FB|nr:hypothetical protein [Chryseobacterium sp. CH21]